MDKFTVKKDTREKEGYYWTESDFCTGYIEEKLDYGDYTLIGFEDVLSVERKASTAELAKNVHEARFERELNKLSKFKYSYLLLEFSLSDILNFPLNSGIPNKKWKYLKVTGQYLLRKLSEYQVKYDIKILFCDNKKNAWIMLNSIFKRVYETRN